MADPERLVCRRCQHAEEGELGSAMCPTDGTVLLRQVTIDRYFTDPMLGMVVAGKYAVVELLGVGGFGAVYHAVQALVGRAVALKVIHPGHAGKQELRKRFFREAKAVARLSHSATVTLHDYGEEGDLLYMVLEYVRGEALRQTITKEAPMEPFRVVHLAEQILGALAEAHKLGLVHRDLKPPNIMVTSDSLGEEKAKVLDFGLAKLLAGADGIVTKQNQLLGTPNYLAPEQVTQHDVDHRADLYSLGVMLYEMLTGERPFNSPNPVEVLRAHVNHPVPPMPAALDVPSALEDAVRKAMAKAPKDRFADAKEMIDALRVSIAPSDTRPLDVSPARTPELDSLDRRIAAELEQLGPGDTARMPLYGLAPDAFDTEDTGPPADPEASWLTSDRLPQTPSPLGLADGTRTVESIQVVPNDASWISEIKGEIVSRPGTTTLRARPVASPGRMLLPSIFIAAATGAGIFFAAKELGNDEGKTKGEAPEAKTEPAAPSPDKDAQSVVAVANAEPPKPDAAVVRLPTTTMTVARSGRFASPEQALRAGLRDIELGRLKAARATLIELSEMPNARDQTLELADAIRNAKPPGLVTSQDADSELARALAFIEKGEIDGARKILRELSERADAVPQMRELSAAVRAAERAPGP